MYECLKIILLIMSILFISFRLINYIKYKINLKKISEIEIDLENIGNEEGLDSGLKLRGDLEEEINEFSLKMKKQKIERLKKKNNNIKKENKILQL